MLSSKAFKINFRGKIDKVTGGGFEIQKIAQNTSKHVDLDDLIEPTPMRQPSEKTTHREEELQTNVQTTHEDFYSKPEVQIQNQQYLKI